MTVEVRVLGSVAETDDVQGLLDYVADSGDPIFWD
jgi:hypothetical protein